MKKYRQLKNVVLLIITLFLIGCPAYEVTINTPFDGEHFEVGEEITFNGSAKDFQDGELDGNSLVWTSNIDGEIGVGNEFSRDDLSEGTHKIILTATNSLGEEWEDTITISIGEETDTTTSSSTTTTTIYGSITTTISSTTTTITEISGEIEYNHLIIADASDSYIETQITGQVPFLINEDGNVEGEGTVTLTASGYSEDCTVSDNGPVDVTVEGMLVSERDLIINLIDIWHHSLTVVCPEGSATSNYSETHISGAMEFILEDGYNKVEPFQADGASGVYSWTLHLND